MNICLIGHGIPCLILANVLTNKNIKISIFDEGNYKKGAKKYGVLRMKFTLL